MSNDGDSGPVWTRARRKSGNPLWGGLVALLAILGLVTAILAGLDHSFAKGGAQLDGWIGAIANAVTGAKSKAVAMDNSTPVEPASAPSGSQPASAAPAASGAPAAASSAPAKH